ncbi:hypothetical protein ACH4UY_04810 [Streptomyces longwoodensis]|uniref:hypothetical protein n=1 Tax=Streptomyces longwoodensis TaxID=68231 RepID=UPI00379B9933
MPEIPRMRFFGGPSDGLDRPGPEDYTTGRVALVRCEPDPSQFAVYVLRVSALEAEEQQIIYDYAGMLPVLAD